MMLNARDYIPVAVAARWLNCSHDSILRYLESGQLEGFRRTPRGWWMVRADSVQNKLREYRDNFPEERISVTSNG
jgi:hypothetical protein